VLSEHSWLSSARAAVGAEMSPDEVTRSQSGCDQNGRNLHKSVHRMYETHFGFHRQPFQANDLRAAYYSSESARSIIPHLLHAMRTDPGIAVLTGPAGCGKTALLRHLRQLLLRDGRAAICSGAALNCSSELLRLLNNAAGQNGGEVNTAEQSLRSEQISRWLVTNRLQRSGELWGPAILLLDDAHLMPVSVLNEIRAFTEEIGINGPLVRCLISGPLSFEEDLARSAYSDFGHGIRSHEFLQPLTMRESVEYLQMQLKAVGGELSSVLTSGAVSLISTACDGSPRCINLLADETFVIAAERKMKCADEHSVRAALQRLQHLPYAWNMSSEADESEFAGEASGLAVEASGLAGKASRQFTAGQPRTTTAKADSTCFSAGIVEKACETMRHDKTSSNLLPGAAAGTGARFVMEFGADGVVEERLDEAVHAAVAASAENSPAQIPFTAIPSAETVPAEMVQAATVPAPAIEFSAIEVVYHSAEEFRDSEGLVADVAESFELESLSPVDLTYSSDFHRIPEKSVEALTEAQPVQNRIPVFDRYTWVALGRDVPAGESVMLTTRYRTLLTDDSLLVKSATASGVTGSIVVHDCTDTEIMQLLSGSRGQSENGVFSFRRPAGHESIRDNTTSVGCCHAASGSRKEMPNNVSVIEYDAGVSDQESFSSAWRDGQLLHSATALSDSTESADEMVSIPIRPLLAGTVSTSTLAVESGGEMTSSEADETAASGEDSFDRNISRRDRRDTENLHFYTLSVPVVSADGVMRPMSKSVHDIDPIAATVAGLQADVDKFNRRLSGSRDDIQFSPSPSQHESPKPDESLEQTTDCAAGIPNSGNQESSMAATAENLLQHAAKRLAAATDDHYYSAGSYPSANQADAESGSRFGRMFTRLRNLRQKP
jgi:type II secretory pathway predicted ATPase ExeA